MNTTKDLIPRSPQEVAALREPTPMDMMQTMLKSGVTAENVSAFTELV